MPNAEVAFNASSRIVPWLRHPSTMMALLLALTVFAASYPRAEDAAPLEEPFVTWERTAAEAKDVLEERSASTEALEELRKRLAEQRKAAFEIAESGSIDVRTLQVQLDALGPLPSEGETEPDEVASRRSEINKELATANRPIIASREAYERADLLIAEVDSLIRDQTTSKLLTRSPTPLLPSSWVATISEVSEYSQRIASDLREQFRYPAERARLETMVPSILFLIAIGILLLALAMPLASRRLLRAAEGLSRSWRRWSLLVLRNLCHVLIPGLGAASILLALRMADIAPASTSALAATVPTMAAVLVIAHWLGHSLFIPVDASRQLLGLGDRAGHRGFRLCQALGLLLAAELGLEGIETDFAFSPETVAVLGGLIVLVGSLLLWVLARLILRVRSVEEPAAGLGAEDGSGPNQFPTMLARLMQVSAVLAPVFAAIGLVGLARETLIPMIISIGLIGFAYFTFQVVMAALGIISGRDYAAEDDDSSLLPFAVISLLAMVLIPLLALAWGARTADIAEVWHLLIDGVKFGETRISLEAVIKLIVVFGTGMVLTRWFQKLLRTTVLPRTRLDLGGQTALVTGVGYVGLTLAALIAVSAAGLNLSSLAVVAGALSVGIGFGLQTIVSNFVSGIILLIERPIKEGDWIEVSGYSGVVRKIAVRSTRIETFDQHDVIVPNSDLIAGTVKNMTLSSKTGRLVIPVGIAYGSDLEATRRIMLDAAANNQMVMRQPAPAVMFIGLGESSLDFELRCYLHEVGAGVSARSEILFEIYNELGKAGIEIPFPQRDIHLRDIDRLIEAIAGRALSPKLKGRSQTTTGTEAENAAQAK